MSDELTSPRPGPDLSNHAKRPFVLKLIHELAALALIIAVFVGLAWSSLTQKSVTFDEFAHLPIGLSYLRKGDFRLEAFSSPLIRLLAALPHLNSEEVKLPLEYGWHERKLWNFGYEFMSANQQKYHRIFCKSRAVILTMAVGIIILVWWWTRGLLGKKSAIAAAAVCAFDPNILAHSRLVTGDVGATLTFLAAVVVALAFCRRPTRTRALFIGVTMGLAVLSKFSALILLVLLPIAAFLFNRNTDRPRPRLLILYLSIAFIMTWITVCTFFMWRGVGRPLNSYTFDSKTFKRLQTSFIAGLPIPLPADWISGMDFTNAYNEEKGMENYLLGEIYRGNRPYYFAVALAAKTPLATIALTGWGLVTLFIKSPRRWRDEWFIVIPPAVVIAFISFSSNYNIGLRYILPAFPFLFIIAAHPLSDERNPSRITKATVTALVGGGIVSSVLIYPHYLAYFNIAAGGAEKGHLVLADSNIDWGQDLIGIEKYMEDEKIDSVCLVYFGRADPFVYGVDHKVPDQPDECETLAVSVQYILGFTYTIISGNDLFRYPPGVFKYLGKHRPDAVIGHTIWVFRKSDGSREESP
jgi:4-amino-4-deoxy-L-arabinose transferase-like glycosyltransferase